jgi:O-antigen/teichoic acid export membrane protein
MATLRTAREQLAKAATASRDMLMLVALPGLVAVVAAAEPLMRLLFGPGWSDVPALIAGMLLGALCVLRRLLVQVALNIIGRSATTFAAFTAESALALGLLVLLTPFGVIGAAIARGFSFALGWLVMFASGRAQLGLPLAGELRQLIVDLVVAAAAVAGTRLLFAGATFANDLTAMVALGATAGCFALAVMCVIRFAVARELMQQLMQALRRR